MKKFVIALAALALTAGMASAQDINAALEVYNNAIAQAEFDKEAALTGLKDALQQGLALGDEGAELVANCKNAIPSLTLSLAKTQINEGEFDKAAETLATAEAVAKEYGNEEIPAEIPMLMLAIYKRRGAQAFKDQNWEAALADLSKVVAADTTDGNTYVKIGQAQTKLGNIDDALEAFKLAAANGKEQQVSKTIANIYKKKAIAAQKAGNLNEAIENLAASNQYNEDPGNFRSIGGLYNKLGKLKDSNEAYIKYLELAPNAPDADGVKYTIAVNAQKVKDFATARAYYSKLLGNETYAAEAKKQLGLLK